MRAPISLDHTSRRRETVRQPANERPETVPCWCSGAKVNDPAVRTLVSPCISQLSTNGLLDALELVSSLTTGSSETVDLGSGTQASFLGQIILARRTCPSLTHEHERTPPINHPSRVTVYSRGGEARRLTERIREITRQWRHEWEACTFGRSSTWRYRKRAFHALCAAGRRIGRLTDGESSISDTLLTEPSGL